MNIYTAILLFSTMSISFGMNWTLPYNISEYANLGSLLTKLRNRTEVAVHWLNTTSNGTSIQKILFDGHTAHWNQLFNAIHRDHATGSTSSPINGHVVEPVATDGSTLGTTTPVNSNGENGGKVVLAETPFIKITGPSSLKISEAEENTSHMRRAIRRLITRRTSYKLSHMSDEQAMRLAHLIQYTKREECAALVCCECACSEKALPEYRDSILHVLEKLETRSNSSNRLDKSASVGMPIDFYLDAKHLGLQLKDSANCDQCHMNYPCQYKLDQISQAMPNLVRFI